ncbi:MAG: DUF1566 domain-containing protein [Sinimarinibacterium sp.]
MTTATIAAPNTQAAGAVFGGGLYAGRIFVGAQAFELVLAPKEEGEHPPTKWHKNLKAVAGATSWCDGQANTAAMATAGSPLAKWARDLRIDGHDDWYLPSRLEALVLFGELQPEFERDWYWTSTQHASYPECAWIQHFLSGGQNGYRKDLRFRARAVRRVPIR